MSRRDGLPLSTRSLTASCTLAANTLPEVVRASWVPVPCVAPHRLGHGTVFHSPLFLCSAGSEAEAPIESTTARSRKEEWKGQLKTSAKRPCRVFDNHGGAGALILEQPGVKEKLYAHLSVDQIAEACRSNPLSLMGVEGVSGLVPADVTASVISATQTLLRGIQRNLGGCEGSSDAWSYAVKGHRAEEADEKLYRHQQDEEQRLRDETDAHWKAYGEAENGVVSVVSAK